MAINKDNRIHVKNIKAYIPPVERDEMVSRGTTASSIYAYFLLHDSIYVPSISDDQRQALTFAFCTYAAAIRFKYGFNEACVKWTRLCTKHKRPRSSDFTPADEMFFQEHAAEVTYPSVTPADVSYRDELLQTWELKHNSTLLLDRFLPHECGSDPSIFLRL
ncbi:hypothetical protein SARC_05399 [Sphaeroforma arctica JP610]|uniref:Uncharacterized protein n=1 Tax=Sphaeroforma arctica JP610 TaxID=667725 RepID=A0A0L0FZN1_9EUKA|nr:hypothetical protein SARC_05399 [Sphaeroforma arctica JP610]KNC82307.1 hypothetical protein SARC_05399 [Sphaeroforma arctica JP610]|eukprot:XP_014156209.1 hypothetical protein SARC_05399 [Sphaeroforma arctica JP610]